jgi:hypothetical protein
MPRGSVMKKLLLAFILCLWPLAAEAQWSLPAVPVVNGLPGTCSFGQFAVNVGAGNQGPHWCEAPNTWAQLAEGGGSGDFSGPASSTANALVRFSGTGGKTGINSAVTLSDAGAFTLPDNIRQVFNPGADAAGFNLGSANSDPGTPTAGDLFYDGDDHLIRARVNATWRTLLHSGSSLADLATRSASDLSSGTLPDARFPATLPAASGANLTALNATQLTSGTVPDARFPATLPAASGANLTALNATNLSSGTVPDARFPATLPALSGVNLTALNASNLGSGTVPDARFPSSIPITAAPTITDGVRVTFNPNGTNAGFNVGSHAGDPGSPTNGDCWYDSVANELTCRINGANVALGAGGGGGNVATDNIWDVAGDTVYGSGSNTGVRLAIGTAGLVYRVNSGATAPEWGQVQTAGIGDSQVTLAKIASQATNTVLANITGSSAPPVAVTYTDLLTDMGVAPMDTLPSNDAVSYYDFSDLRFNFLNQLTVPLGGSGAATLTGLLQGNGTSAFTAVTNSSTGGQVLRVTGAATYGWGALDLSDSDAITSDLPLSNFTQAGAASRLLGRGSAGGAGDYEPLTIGASMVMNGTVLERAALTGDVTASQNSNDTTIANDAVSYAKMQNISATSRVLGRITSGAGDTEELTAANLKTILSTLALRPLYLFNAGGCDNTTAGTGLNLFTSNRPTAACTTGTNTTFGRLQFTATAQQAQGHISIPSDISGTTMTVSGHYFGETTSAGNTTWRFSWARVAPGGTLDPAWTDCDISDAAGTANQLNLFTSTSCTITGLTAGDLFLWKITYQTAPTTPGNHNLISLFLQPLRDYVIGG